MAKKRGKRTANQPSSAPGPRASRAPSRAPARAAVAEAPASRRLELVSQEQEERLESGEHARVSAPAATVSGVSVVDDAPASADLPAEPMRAKAPSDPDEISIPPAADVDMEKFFAEGDSTPLLPETGPASHHDLHDFEEPPRSVRHLEPEVAERRAFFAKRVRWVVAVAAVLGLAGFVRGALTHGGDAPANATVAAVAAPKAAEPVKAEPAAKPAEPAAKPAEPAAKPAEVVADKPAEAKAAEPAKADETKPAEAKPAEAKADEAKPAADTADKPTKTAAQEKVDSRRALEAGRAGDAITAGERSVALDPSDGEAWLILGAAYQEKGRGGDARKAFASCVKQGKRGPVSECAAMLQ